MAEFRNPCKFWPDILKGHDVFEDAGVLAAQYPIASQRNMVCGWTWTDLFGSESILILNSPEHSNNISSIMSRENSSVAERIAISREGLSVTLN